MEIGPLNIYRGRKVFITGHTGFKGSWLALVLKKVGAEICGYSLAPQTSPNHFSFLNLEPISRFGNILDAENLQKAILAEKPEIIFHLAAQPLVRLSYKDPVNTYQTNVIGSLQVLEAARQCDSVRALVMITTDKVYDNKESTTPYTETDRLGGYDMYSSSKACCEILISSYRNSFLNPDEYKKSHNILIATARAGNVIGGGDWSADRLIPDMVKAAAENQTVQIRSPKAVRPWQHVLDSIYGYLLLGEKLLKEEKAFADAFNFSPAPADVKNVEEITAIAQQCWNKIEVRFERPQNDVHEAGLLILDNSKSRKMLGWHPIWNTEEAIQETINWYKAFYLSGDIISERQIETYLRKATGK